MRKLVLGAAAAIALGAGSAQAADPVKIGFITTLAGPAGYIGEDSRDAFLLAVKLGGGKLGGVPVSVTVEDDGLQPGKGKQIAERFLKDDNMKIITGVIFSNVLLAVAPTVTQAGAFYVSNNAAPSQLAGKGCDKNYFVVSWQNDTLHESAGQYATNLGYKKMVILAPNYAAGKDALTGFKRFYKGQVIAEIYTKLNQTDFAAEMAQIRDAKPDAVFQFHPGGLGITFAKQYVQAGLMKSIPMLVASPGMDDRIMNALGDNAVGVVSTTHWNWDYDNASNKEFVAEFRKAYNRMPDFYASQAYDAALLIGSALKAVGGDMSKADAFRAALKKADFASTRGKFRFGPNNHPIQDWYSRKVEKTADGKLENRTFGSKVLTDRGDAYSDECKM